MRVGFLPSFEGMDNQKLLKRDSRRFVLWDRKTWYGIYTVYWIVKFGVNFED